MLATDQGQRARMIDYMEVHAPARSRDLASIGVNRTTIARAVTDGVVVRIGRGVLSVWGCAWTVAEPMRPAKTNREHTGKDLKLRASMSLDHM